MNNHQLHVSTAFNKAAATYTSHALTQKTVGIQLIKKIIEYQDRFQRVLDAGCGTGIITSALAKSIHYQNIYAIDIAAALLNETKSRLGDRIQSALLDFDDIGTYNDSYHLIFSNMSLQWSPSLSHTLQTFYSRLAPHGILAFTIPLAGTFTEISDYCGINTMPFITEVTSTLQASGYNILHTSEEHHIEHFDDTISALRSIKLTGASHVTNRKAPNTLVKAFINSNKVRQLSYVIGFFIARKPHE